MKDYLIMSCCGLFFFVVGILLIKRQKRLFEDFVITKATVVEYDETQGPGIIFLPEFIDKHLRAHYYTLKIEYKLEDGTLIQVREPATSTLKRYRVGKELEIKYSKKNNETFIINGNHTNTLIFWGLIIVGLVMMICFRFGIGV